MQTSLLTLRGKLGLRHGAQPHSKCLVILGLWVCSTSLNNVSLRLIVFINLKDL